MNKKIFIIAGEASGDLHGKNLVKAILEKEPNSIVQAYGGPKMQSAGAEIVRNYESYAFMGFYEVAKNIRTVVSNLKATEEIILKAQPNILVFIDFPGFNLRIAKSLKSKLQNTKFYYYIAPQVWAWKSNRVHALNKLMDRIFVILPFEKAFFAKYGYDVEFVGHPLMDELDGLDLPIKEKNLVAVLPGSREQEIKKMLPKLKSLAQQRPNLNFEVSKMTHIPIEFYENIIGAYKTIPNLRFTTRTTYELLSAAEKAIVTSGTATLETALLGTPQLVAYSTSPISYWIAKRVVDIQFISLVNLILNKAAIPELIQKDFTQEKLAKTLDEISNAERKSEILSNYENLKRKLGGKGASKLVANAILSGS